MTPEIIGRAGPLLARYEAVLCDIWGVVHSGGDAHAEAIEALERFRAGGGTVVLVSNAPMASDGLARLLDAKRLPRSAWDAIVCSGDIALAHIAEQGYARVHRIGPAERDRSFFERLPGPDTPLENADAVACTGLVDDRRETPEQYLPLLRRARARELPLICANPDLVVEVRGTLLACAGAVARIYEEDLGGSVFWAGKPHASAYRAARARIEALRGGPVAPSALLAIGDAVRTDLAAAKGAGVDSLFITSGIHRTEVMLGDAIDPRRLAALLEGARMPARAAMPALRW